MKRFVLPISLLVVAAVAVGGWFIVDRPADGPLETQRVLDGLQGKVEKVTVETAPLFGSGGWSATGGLESETTYTPQGTLLEVSRYGGGDLEYRLVHRYADDRLVEETSFGPGGEPLYTWTHTYDDRGRLARLSGFDDRGGLEVNTLYGYDAQDRLVTETSYSADETLSYEAAQRYDQGYTRSTVYFVQGAAESRLEESFDASARRLAEASYSPAQELQYRVEYSYGDRGNLLTESAFDADGNAEYRLENRYDAAGRLLETVEYDADGEPFYRYSYAYNDVGDVTKRESRGVDGSGATLAYTYSYDDHGNWTERRTSKLVERSGAEALEPSEVTRRTLSYY